jgi:CspA family cold shock protein
MTTGIVKSINYAKGFGYITPDNGGHDVFALLPGQDAGGGRKLLRQNQKVSFDVTATANGAQAVNVKPIA